MRQNEWRQKNGVFLRPKKRSILTRNQLEVREIEIADLMDLPYRTWTLSHSPRSFERKPTSLDEGVLTQDLEGF